MPQKSKTPRARQYLRLRAEMLMRGITYKDLAHITDRSVGYISDCMNGRGRRQFSINEAHKIKRFVGLSALPLEEIFPPPNDPKKPAWAVTGGNAK